MRGGWWSERVTKGAIGNRGTEDDEVVHHTAERVREFHCAYSSSGRYTHCMRNALMIGVDKDLRLVVQALKMRRQNTTL